MHRCAFESFINVAQLKGVMPKAARVLEAATGISSLNVFSISRRKTNQLHWSVVWTCVSATGTGCKKNSRGRLPVTGLNSLKFVATCCPCIMRSESWLVTPFPSCWAHGGWIQCTQLEINGRLLISSKHAQNMNHCRSGQTDRWHPQWPTVPSLRIRLYSCIIILNLNQLESISDSTYNQ